MYKFLIHSLGPAFPINYTCIRSIPILNSNQWIPLGQACIWHKSGSMTFFERISHREPPVWGSPSDVIAKLSLSPRNLHKVGAVKALRWNPFIMFITVSIRYSLNYKCIYWNAWYKLRKWLEKYTCACVS